MKRPPMDFLGLMKRRWWSARGMTWPWSWDLRGISRSLLRQTWNWRSFTYASDVDHRDFDEMSPDCPVGRPRCLLTDWDFHGVIAQEVAVPAVLNSLHA